MWQQLQSNIHYLIYVNAIGAMVLATWAVFRSWLNKRAYGARGALEEIAVEYSKIDPVPPRRAKRAKSPAPDALTVVDFDRRMTGLQEELRRSALFGFLQNLFFFFAGTVASVIAPKLFP